MKGTAARKIHTNRTGDGRLKDLMTLQALVDMRRYPNRSEWTLFGKDLRGIEHDLAEPRNLPGGK